MHKTFRLPSKAIASLPIPKTVYEPKPLYSLYKNIDGRWFQVRVNGYPIECAARIWGDFVVRNPTSFSIRRAQFDYNQCEMSRYQR